MNREERILAERAAKLAEPIEDEAKYEKIEYILFSLGDSTEYGIDYSDVEAVVKPDQICAIPLAPETISGVINWRGNLLSVINLNHFLSKKTDSLGKDPWVVVVKSEGNPVGLAVNEVGTNRFYLKEELTAKRQSSAKSISYIQGIVAKKVAIIDIKTLLKDVRL